MRKQVRVIGFVRVSTEIQDYNRQVDDITSYCDKHNLKLVDIISEKISGATKNEKRKGVQELLKKAHKGEFDKVVTCEMSRVGRTAFEVQKIVEELIELNISLIILNLNIETLNDDNKRNPLSDLLIAVVNQFSQMERQTLIERINSGIKSAKAKGKHCGRKLGTNETNDSFLKKYPNVIRDLKTGISLRKVAKLNDIALGTVQKVNKLMKEPVLA